MREDQEALIGVAGENGSGHIIGRDAGLSRKGTETVTDLGQCVEHRSTDELGTEARHPDSGVAVGDRQPLRQRDHGMLGDAVRSGSHVGEQPGRRGRVHEISLATLHHAGQHGPHAEDVGHHVDVPAALPELIGLVDAATDGDSGVEAQHVDGSEPFLGGRHHLLDGGLGGNVRCGRQAPDLAGDRSGRRPVDVGNDHTARSG